MPPVLFLMRSAFAEWERFGCVLCFRQWFAAPRGRGVFLGFGVPRHMSIRSRSDTTVCAGAA